MKDLIIYIVDDILNIVYKDRVINIKLSGVICKGYIIDRLKFIEIFLKILKKEKIKNKLFGDSITIVKSGYYKVSDLFYLENIFLELGFLKVNFFDIRELFLDKLGVYIEVNNSYVVVYLDDALYFDLKYFKSVSKIINYLDNIDGDIVLFGVNQGIPNVKVNKKMIYYFENHITYVTDSLLKVKKCDV